MGWKGNLVDIPLGLASRLVTPRGGPLPSSPSIFILRNNDIGDLLVTTPLFEALRTHFPSSEIVVGIGSWNFETLRGNPYPTEIAELNAPWNNKYVRDQSWPAVARYLASSPDLRPLQRRFDIGIDVVGSHIGAALMMRLGIPYRLGVRGYRGGHTAVQQYVTFNPQEHVGRSALRFAELLGARVFPEPRPQIFLSAEERAEGETRWPASPGKRIILGIGAGFPEKCWPQPHWYLLLDQLELQGWDVVLVGGAGDVELAEKLAHARPGVTTMAGDLTLRQTFSLAAAADAIITNPSMLMHVGAAFYKPTVVVLGPYFSSGAAHDSQWGYPATCISLGRDRMGKFAMPADVLEALGRLLPA